MTCVVVPVKAGEQFYIFFEEFIEGWYIKTKNKRQLLIIGRLYCIYYSVNSHELHLELRILESSILKISL